MFCFFSVTSFPVRKKTPEILSYCIIGIIGSAGLTVRAVMVCKPDHQPVRQADNLAAALKSLLHAVTVGTVRTGHCSFSVPDSNNIVTA